MSNTRNFAEVIRKSLAGDDDLAALVEEESFNAHVATEIYEARTSAGLTQSQLAERVGSHQSVIARLENADYDGHSLAMLKRIAQSLGKKVRVEFYAPSSPTYLASAGIDEKPTWRAAPEWSPTINDSPIESPLLKAVG